MPLHQVLKGQHLVSYLVIYFYFYFGLSFVALCLNVSLEDHHFCFYFGIDDINLSSCGLFYSSLPLL